MKRSPVFLVLLLGLTLVVGCSQTSKSETVNQQAAAVSGQENSTANDAVDIVSYQGNRKLKVSEDEELYRMTALMEYCGSTGINIKEIHNGEVKGTIFSRQGVPSYRQAEVAFTGKIEGGKLKASYKDDAWMYSGSIELAFSNGQIEAVITRDKSNDTPRNTLAWK